MPACLCPPSCAWEQGEHSGQARKASGRTHLCQDVLFWGFTLSRTSMSPFTLTSQGEGAVPSMEWTLQASDQLLQVGGRGHVPPAPRT